MGKVICFTTGGTIASAYDASAGGFLPAIDGQALVRSVPGLGDVADLQVVELANASSHFFTPDLVFGWTGEVSRRLSEPDVLGAVVTHGTDTLEESAYLFDLVLAEEKPVVFTGAMRTPSNLAPDGPRNLLSAVRTAAHPDARDLGVLVVFDDEIHAARDVTKSHAEAVRAFTSPNLGPLGRISGRWKGDDVLVFRRPLRREHIPAPTIETRVAYVKVVMGSDSVLVDAATEAGAVGLVLEAFGGGEVSPYMTDGIERALEKGVTVVVATRALRGRPLDLWADRGGGKWLGDRGVFFAGYLTGPKARIKLMLALGLNEPARVAEFFD